MTPPWLAGEIVRRMSRTGGRGVEAVGVTLPPIQAASGSEAPASPRDAPRRRSSRCPA